MIPTKEQKIDEKLAQMFRDRSDGAGGLREFSWAEFINEAVSFYHTIRESDRAEMVNLPEMQDEDVFLPDDYELIARNDLRARIRSSLGITKE